MKFTSLLKRFAKSEKGNVAIMFGLSVVPLMAAAGVAIDFARFSTVQTQLQGALDAGSLAAALARNKSDGQRSQIGNDTFIANMKHGEVTNIAAHVNFIVKQGTVVANANLDLPTSLLAVIGINTMDVAVKSEVNIPPDKKAEIAFVLDYSGSMADMSGAEVKYIAMKKAATKLIDDIIKDNADKVKFALVPFSHHVYTNLPNADVLGKGNTGSWVGCTQDRQYPFNLSDTTPGVNPDTKWGQPNAPDHAAWGCNGYATHHLKIRALTDDFDGLKSQLAAMTPYAYTHVPLGVEFGYNVLSPNEPFTEGVSYADKTTQKYMVVLTDGTQTEPAFGPGSVRNVAQGDTNLTDLCSNAKASGITIITLAFDLDDSSQRQRLQTCASNPATDFFVATTSAEMAQAFESITNGISSQAFLSK
jgi:Flp pilus assembly protein TadG